MKRAVTLICSLALAAALCISLCACTPKHAAADVVTDADGTVVITVTENPDGNAKLEDVMDALSVNGKLEYAVSNGMVTAINGKENGDNSYWMLYTDDADYGNEAWGTVERGGKTYLSATLGAGALPVKVGCTYIWVYTSFEV